jgi:hypothetical protein
VSNKYGRIQLSREKLTQSRKGAKRRQTTGIAAKRHKKRKKNGKITVGAFSDNVDVT